MSGYLLHCAKAKDCTTIWMTLSDLTADEIQHRNDKAETRIAASLKLGEPVIPYCHSCGSGWWHTLPFGGIICADCHATIVPIGVMHDILHPFFFDNKDDFKHQCVLELSRDRRGRTIQDRLKENIRLVLFSHPKIIEHQKIIDPYLGEELMSMEDEILDKVMQYQKEYKVIWNSEGVIVNGLNKAKA